MRVQRPGALLVLLVSTGTAAAQEQRGSIGGLVRDPSGALVAGAAVEARSPSLIGRLATTTGASGAYRFPALPPGRYQITAEADGFRAAILGPIDLALGQSLRADLTVAVAGPAEAVQVTAEPPLIDVRQSASFVNLRDELLAKLPRGRDFTTVVAQAQGANSEPRAGGFSIDGASGSDNRFFIDGLDTTNLQSGVSGKGLILDFVEEVQVKSSGYAAEYGGSTGGAVNAITRSGSNSWRGEVGTYISADFLDSGPRPGLRISPTNDSVAEYYTAPKGEYRTWEPGLVLGGPIKKDRLWLFAGYLPSLSFNYQTVTFLTSGETKRFTAADKTHHTTANLTAQVTPRLRARAGLSLSPYRHYGTLPPADGTGDPSTPYGDIGDSEKSNLSASGNFDYIAGDRLYFGLRGGYFRYNTIDVTNPDVVRFRFERTNADVPGVPADLLRPRGFSNVPSNSGTRRDAQTRLSLQLDGTWFASLAGQHAFKAGVQLDRIGNDVFSGFLKQNVRYSWGEAWSTTDGRQVSGKYGYFRAYYFGTFGDIHSNDVGLFVQDSWTIKDRLTLNLGLRSEDERIPSFSTNPAVPDPAIHFSFADKLAPRAGFAWDVRGDGAWKLYGSWGIFYDITKLEMPRGSFGGEQWFDHYFTLDSLDWPNVGSNPECPPTCKGGTLIEVIDRRPPANDPSEKRIDPDLRPMRSRELVLGVQHALNAGTYVGLRYVRKQIDRAIEDSGLIRQGNEVFFIVNPGFGLGRFLIPGLPAQPRAVRDYDGLELDVRRRLTRRLAFHASYLWSRLYGNYSGLASSDENGRTSPNVNRFFDELPVSFDQGGRPSLGRLPTDRPHQLKAQAVLDLPFGTTLGLSFFAISGTPVSRTVNLSPQIPVYHLGRGSDGRSPGLSLTDLFVQHAVRLRGRKRLVLSANVSNLFDQKRATGVFNVETQSDLAITTEQYLAGVDVEKEIDRQAITRDPRFLKEMDFQGPRSVRLQVKLAF